MPTADPILTGVRAVLAVRYDVDQGALALRRLPAEDIGDRSWAARVAIHGLPAGAPATVVAKRARREGFDPGDPAPVAASGCSAEWAGLRLLDGSGLAPAYLGVDRPTGCVVLEDLAPATDLCALLHGSDRTAAEDALVGYARLLGRLHAGTAGRLADYLAAWADLAPGRPPPAPGDDLDRLVPMAEAACRAAGLAADAAALAEARRAVAAVRDPGPFLAYVHGDPCPDNALRTGHGLRLIDFEAGGFGCCLLDAAYPRLLWPTCWCAGALSPDLLARVEAAYRAELVAGIPAAADDRAYADGMLAACAVHALRTLADLLPIALQGELAAANLTYHGVRRPKRRQRVVHRMERFVATSEELRGMPALATFCATLAARLRRCWPEDADPLPSYPALAR